MAGSRAGTAGKTPAAARTAAGGAHGRMARITAHEQRAPRGAGLRRAGAATPSGR